MINKELFDFVRIKPFTRVLNISQAQFTQRLHKHKVNGYEQSFKKEETHKMKLALLSLSEMLRVEAEKM
jgi:hypothetical protein